MHISELSDRYVKEPGDVVKVGQIVKVHVLSADAKTKRIALSMKTPGAMKTPGRKPAPNVALQSRKPAVLPTPPSMDDKLAALADRWKKR